MARISTYPIDTDVVGSDKWIGSDSQKSYSTKNFTADAVADFINGHNKVESTSLRYRYRDYDVYPAMQPGTISFPTYRGSNTPFSGIDSFTISQTQIVRDLDSLGDFYSNPLIGSVVMISQCDKISNWGAFRWTNSVVQAPVRTSNNYYTISLEYLSGPGFFEDKKDYFISILTYDSNASNDKNFVYTQVAKSDLWQVTHGLNKFCSVEVVNSSEEVIYPNVEYTSLNTVTISFSSAQNGQAFFN
tara:strand:- start:4198 stop:4932 length:735 start_codon:yes stop_codon:yes gene_type:complete